MDWFDLCFIKSEIKNMLLVIGGKANPKCEGKRKGEEGNNGWCGKWVVWVQNGGGVG